MRTWKGRRGSPADASSCPSLIQTPLDSPGVANSASDRDIKSAASYTGRAQVPPSFILWPQDGCRLVKTNHRRWTNRTWFQPVVNFVRIVTTSDARNFTRQRLLASTRHLYTLARFAACSSKKGLCTSEWCRSRRWALRSREPQALQVKLCRGLHRPTFCTGFGLL